MKTYPLIAFIAATAAFAFSVISFESAVSLLFIGGLARVVLHDYARETSRVRIRQVSVARLPLAA